jgi:hypothetical protein
MALNATRCTFLVLERAALAVQRFQNMPGNRFTFAIRVSGQDQLVGVFQRIGDGLDAFWDFALDLPVHGKVFVRAHRSVLGGQVAHMAETGEHVCNRLPRYLLMVLALAGDSTTTTFI